MGRSHNSREYAVIGSSEGTHIFDVTDPINAKYVEYILDTGISLATLKDYHDYKGYL